MTRPSVEPRHLVGHLLDPLSHLLHSLLHRCQRLPLLRSRQRLPRAVLRLLLPQLLRLASVQIRALLLEFLEPPGIRNLRIGLPLSLCGPLLLQQLPGKPHQPIGQLLHLLLPPALPLLYLQPLEVFFGRRFPWKP
ncbi:hypothetical protein ACWD5R_45205 [Streptomyces sp. NPDC002514]|uniref:hypothetical protein n=1 Tax=Streptomyces sp. NPDC001270 TaxID=3364554 RepID=UPI0036B06B89